MKRRKGKKDIKLFDITKLRWAIEIEVEFPNTKDSQKLIDRHSMIKGWEMDGDFSLDNGVEYRPKKNNHLYWNEESLTQLKEVLALIRVHKGKTYKSCGLHIHIDCNKFSARQIYVIITEWLHKQRYIVKRFKVHPDRLENQCMLLPKEMLKAVNIRTIDKFRKGLIDNWNCKYLDEKSMSLNTMHLAKGNYGTLEFRLFNGTLNYKKLKEQILWTLTFIKDCIERE